MPDRAQVRCPACGSAVTVAVVWALGDACPCCSEPLHVAHGAPIDDAPTHRGYVRDQEDRGSGTPRAASAGPQTNRR